MKENSSKSVVDRLNVGKQHLRIDGNKINGDSSSAKPAQRELTAPEVLKHTVVRKHTCSLSNSEISNRASRKSFRSNRNEKKHLFISKQRTQVECFVRFNGGKQHLGIEF